MLEEIIKKLELIQKENSREEDEAEIAFEEDDDDDNDLYREWQTLIDYNEGFGNCLKSLKILAAEAGLCSK